MPTPGELLAAVPDRLLIAAIVLVIGVLLGYASAVVNRRLLERAGVPETVEGTAFERTMHGFGSSTVAVVAKLSMWFIIGIAVLAALSVANVQFTIGFWSRVTSFLPTLFVATLVLIVGVVVGDKVELVIGERLRGVKLPQIGVLPRLAKYSVVYVAVLVALGQIGIATGALVVMLGAYLFAVVFLGGLAFKDLLASGAAGMYLILTQPYGIGDRVRIDGRSGVVQEVTPLVTRIESDDEEFIVPNRKVFEGGVVRVRG